MDCQACGHPGADDARFCGECGQPLALELHCGECGAAAPPGQKFCTSCGTPLSPAAGGPRKREPSNPDLRAYTPSYLQDRIRAEAVSLEGERKQVTVLFADITGSMELAGQVDAEEWRHVMDGFFALLCDGVHRFEGSVNKFTGDGIMALFGAPIAHEDHARRACYAAIHLREELARYAGDVRREHGLNFSVRMGVNSGEVVVGAVGDDLNLDYTAIGHTVGLASRIEQLAEPGKAYVTAATAALVEGWFTLVDLGDFGIKGVSEPVRVLELAGTGSARTRVEASEARGLSRFVGRDQEVAALDAAATRALESGGQVVGIVADPGLGKSRLCYEFVEGLRAKGYEITEGRGVAHGRRIPLLPVLEMMRDYFGIDDDDSERQARDKVAGRLLLLDDEFKDVLPVVFDFLGVPDPERPPPSNPEARHRQLISAVRRIVASGGRTGPVATLIEDLHWLDPASDNFLEHFVDALPGSKNLLIVNFRPEYQAEWMRKSYYQQLPLLPLGPEAIAELLRDLLGPDPSLDGLAELVHERTGGNPFFIEEVVQSMAGSGVLEGRKGAYRLVKSVDQIAIPPTVQAVLAARIDRLPEREKTLLQRASVIGRDFSEAVLARVAGLPEHELSAALHALVAAEFIFERSLYPDPEYSFKHPLTEEVAYQSQLGERRVKSHAAVAAAIAEVYAERLDELSAVIANHWEAAKRPLEAAQWKCRAAGWTAKNHPTEALRHWRAVRSLVRTLPESPESTGLLFGACFGILQVGGWRTGMPESEIAAVYSDGLRAAEALGERRLEIALMGLYGLARTFVGEVEEALEIVERASVLARELGDDELIGGTSPAYNYGILGRLYEALVAIDESVAISRDDPTLGMGTLGFSMHAWAVGYRGYQILIPMGRIAEGRADVERSVELAREYGDLETLQWALGTTAMVAVDTGEPGNALSCAREAVAIAERQGAAFNRLIAYQSLGLAHIAREEWDEAIASITQAHELLRETHNGLHYEAWILGGLAMAQTLAGRPKRAIEVATTGIEIAQRQHTKLFELQCQISLARALVAADALRNTAPAREALERATQLVGETGARLYDAWIAWTFGDLSAAHGDDSAAEQSLLAAQQLFAQAGATGWAERIAVQAAALHI